MKYLKPIALLLLIFIAGISVGVVGTRYVVRRNIRDAVRQPEKVRLRIERELTRELALDANQQTKLDEILISLQQEIAKARAERQPRIRPILVDTQRRITELLTPEQQLKFEKYQAEYGLFSLGSGQGQNFPRLQKLKKLREERQGSQPPTPPPSPAE
jgi:hypothetical protein